MASQDQSPPKPDNAASEPELDINGNPLPAKSLFAAPASADAQPPPHTPPPVAGQKALPRRSLDPTPRPALETPEILDPHAPVDLAGNRLPTGVVPSLEDAPLEAWKPGQSKSGAARRNIPANYASAGGSRGLAAALVVLGLLLCGLLALFWFKPDALKSLPAAAPPPPAAAPRVPGAAPRHRGAPASSPSPPAPSGPVSPFG